MRSVTIYTDGSYKGKKRAGGWAAHLTCGPHEKLLCGGEMDTTINRMELKAVIEALSILTEPCKVVVYSDSTYVTKGINSWVRGWEKHNWKTRNGQVKNKDLWESVLPLKEYHKLKMVWVEGHSGVAGNELVDRIAQSMADETYEEYRKK